MQTNRNDALWAAAILKALAIRAKRKGDHQEERSCSMAATSILKEIDVMKHGQK